MKFKHFIWDFDGTLLNTYPAMVKAFYKTCVDNDIPADENTILEYMKISVQTVIDFYSKRFSFPPSFLDEFQKNREILEKQVVEPYVDTQIILEEIIDSGNFNYVVTHRGTSTLELLRKYDLEKYFREIVIKEKGFARKPNPQSINYLKEKYEMNNDETVMIGDRILDIEAGRNAMVHTCFYDEFKTEKELGADITISRLSEIALYLKRNY
ncbi:HAD-IA family hydrolase [Anaerorhabdus sp.]|uniref:HAD-IA family hydrolase n=1 Tax=Anaerorhabdus sp. TaxID=1872524 RepID=UPI002B1FB11E|nr:HAD-IA family hydrolase [Anaerorhabdus sp.]MEA4874361.1 HAD-IA family hydrolase [Anaerorhabdus sp.]